MRRPSQKVESYEALGVRVPCWPNPSWLTVLLIAYVGVVHRCLFKQIIFTLVLAFIFVGPVDFGLQAIGYHNDFVSYFPFLRELYSAISQSSRLGPVSTAYFHFLDVVIWPSIAVWGSRFLAGIICLKQYDDFYQFFVARLNAIPIGARLVAYLGFVLFSFAPFGMAYLGHQPTVLNSPLVIMLIRYRVWFLVCAIVYYCSGFFIAEIWLLVLLKIFRQHWPGAIVWHRNSQ